MTAKFAKLAATAGLSLVLLTGCETLGLGGLGLGGGSADGDTRYVARDVETLYRAAHAQMTRGNYDRAAALFDEVERQHPYSVWARRAQVMSAFSHYRARAYTESIASAQRFLAIHPGNRDAPYASYLIALNYYDQISDVSHDQSTTLEALSALGEVVRRYPDSRYATAAQEKIVQVTDHIAGKEMEVGRYYQRSASWLAASLRFRTVTDDYADTSHAPEAYYRLVETYLALGIREEARKAYDVLASKYPNNEWYGRAAKLISEHGTTA